MRGLGLQPPAAIVLAVVLGAASSPMTAQQAGNAQTAPVPLGSVPHRDGHPDLQGYWVIKTDGTPTNGLEEHPASFFRAAGKSLVVDPADGKIPYQTWALAERELRSRPENSYDDPEGHCFPSGPLRELWVMSQPYQILQPAGHVVFLMEYNHASRIIPIDGRPHLPDRIRPWEGDSVGRWDGDTLVVDTTNTNGKTWLDLWGDFVSDRLHLVERFTMVDANTIRWTGTITDPKVFTRPWTMAFTIVRVPDRSFELIEFACHEDNRDLEHMKAIQDAAPRRPR